MASMPKRNSITSPIFESPSFNMRIKSLVNDEFLSDCTFLVGPEKSKIYAHKTILALGSPVFLKMFYGNFKTDDSEPIEIPDLSTTGFLNMLRQIYGHKFDLSDELEQFSETYRCADKYLVYGFCQILIESLDKLLHVGNCLIVYEQIIKSKIELSLLNKIRTMIEMNCSTIFAGELFCIIELETLIDLLNFKKLNITEWEILKACNRWVNQKIDPDESLENKQKLFRTIKSYIRFTDLTIDDMKRCNEFIDNLLDYDEIGKLFIYLLKGSKTLSIDCKTKRERFEFYTVSFPKNFPAIINSYDHYDITGFLNVDRKICISLIRTFLKTEVTVVDFRIFNKTDNKEFILNYERTIYDSVEPKWAFQFKNNQFFEMESQRDYKFYFKFYLPVKPGNLYRFSASNSFGLKVSNGNKIEFKLDFHPLKYHIIESVMYYPPSYV